MQDALRAGWERKERAGWGRGALTWPWEREGTREMIGNNLDSGSQWRWSRGKKRWKTRTTAFLGSPEEAIA